MNKSCIALAIAGIAAGLAITPAAAAPVAPKQIGLAYQQSNQLELVRDDRRRAQRHVHRHRDVHRPNHRQVRRHFWAPGPWAFRGVAPHNCFPIRGGYACYY